MRLGLEADAASQKLREALITSQELRHTLWPGRVTEHGAVNS